MFVCKKGLFCNGCNPTDYGQNAPKIYNQDVVCDDGVIPAATTYYELVSNCNTDMDLGILRTDNNKEVKNNRTTKAWIWCLLDEKQKLTKIDEKIKIVLRNLYDDLEKKDNERILEIMVPFQHIVSYERFAKEQEIYEKMGILACGGCSFQAYRVERSTNQRTLMEEN